jgi:NDP-sugar pyrophosphorylase family protein
MVEDVKPLAATDALILCGGLGTRLSALVSDRPKGLADVGGKPFLDILVEDLVCQGVRRIIFCVGHMKEQIIARYSGRIDAACLFSEEDAPLGTGGAVQNALPLVRSDPFMVMNGDSVCPVDLARLERFHRTNEAEVSLVLCHADERHDGGVVCLDKGHRVTSFLEKSATRDGRFINAGIYLLPRNGAILKSKTPPFSLEYDVFPELANSGQCYGFVVSSRLLDIGTPERYLKASETLGVAKRPPQ